MKSRHKLQIFYTYKWLHALLGVLFVIVLQSHIQIAFAQDGADEIVAGIPANFPPHYSIDEKTGEPVGFAIDVIDEIAGRSGLRVRYEVSRTWKEVLAKIEGGEVDLIPNLGITAERKSYCNFTKPLETFQIRIFVRGTTADIQSDEDLTGRTVAVASANKGLYLMKERGDVELQIHDSIEKALFALLSGNADALVYPDTVVYRLTSETRITDHIKAVGESLLEVKRAIAVRKGNPELLAKLDTAVEAFIVSQEYKEIYARWYAAPEPYWNVKRVIILMLSLLAGAVLSLMLWRYLSVMRLNKALRASNAERKKAEEELRKHRDHLEDMVQERTKELETSKSYLEEAVKEMETFSYSISHDLKAPLRAISGYSGMLQENYPGSLDKESNRILRVINKNAVQMGQLIEDILMYSRMARKPLEMGEIHIKKLAEGVILELKGEYKDREIEFNMQEMPNCKGDSVMIKQVLMNLISNAIKFTRNNEKAKIEVGRKQIENETIYYVRDNGVGFDIKYADKLFGLFQRLHSTKEFEGTGVGLAIVKSLIHKHRGKIWADAKVNEGAVFYFSLDKHG